MFELVSGSFSKPKSSLLFPHLGRGPLHKWKRTNPLRLCAVNVESGNMHIKKRKWRQTSQLPATRHSIAGFPFLHFLLMLKVFFRFWTMGRGKGAYSSVIRLPATDVSVNIAHVARLIVVLLPPLLNVLTCLRPCAVVGNV